MEEKKIVENKTFFIIYEQLLYVYNMYIYNMNIYIYIHIIDIHIIYTQKLPINDYERINQNKI